MRAPEFWAADGAGMASTALLPLAWAYGLAVRARFAAGHPWRAPVPVLCVGNMVAGGAGKTPVALSLGGRLKGLGVAVHFLTRGYGGGAAGPLRVDAQRHAAEEVGDEALLLAGAAPTWVARDRAAGARAAAAAGAGAIVMDDGFQNPALAKDVSLLVVDAAYGFGNGRLMPAGPLREPLAAGLARADAMVVIGPDGADAARRMAAPSGAGLPLLEARTVPGPGAAGLAGKRVLAFAGIARPEKFFRTLRSLDCELVAARAFPDHHAYSARDIESLRRAAAEAGAVPVTTAKDAVRLTPEARRGIEVLTITVRWEDEAALDAVLEPLIRPS